jgi:hypothetical protein
MKEEEIRPQKIFDEYLRLAKEDAETYFSTAKKVANSCPACQTDGNFAFTKHGFSYETCPKCLTLFVNPRPLAEAFIRYYTESPSSLYWATTFYRETAEARREKLWRPKALMIYETLAKYSADDYALIDIGGGFGLFAEEIRALCGRAPTVIEPAPHLASVCRDKSLPVIQKFLEQVVPSDLPPYPKAFISFELFEHLHDPAKFLGQLNKLMSSGDFFIFTTLSGCGVDIQALWENSKSVTPPHHLNFFNPRSVGFLLARSGFEELSITTPGKLDIDIMSNNQEAIKDRFWKTFVTRATDSEKANWQKMIATNGWSSHMMIVCRKP